jgi:hypothetical protein
LVSASQRERSSLKTSIRSRLVALPHEACGVHSLISRDHLGIIFVATATFWLVKGYKFCDTICASIEQVSEYAISLALFVRISGE